MFVYISLKAKLDRYTDNWSFILKLHIVEHYFFFMLL